MRFQSTPPSGERSDAVGIEKTFASAIGWFQSTPPSGERSDGSLRVTNGHHRSFNPRPPPRERSDDDRSR